MDVGKRLDMDSFKDTVKTNRIKMASSDDLSDKMMLPPGVVSPFGLLNNKDQDIKVYFDNEIMSENKMTFHPNTNDKTIIIDTVDLIKFIESIDYNPTIIEL